jgi:hypothetical protein
MKLFRVTTLLDVRSCVVVKSRCVALASILVFFKFKLITATTGVLTGLRL